MGLIYPVALGGEVAVAILSGAHDHFAPYFQRAYPKAIVVGSPSVASSHPELRIDYLLHPNASAQPGTPIPLPASLEALLGGAISLMWDPDEFEIMTYHKPSQSIFSNDVLYTFDSTARPWKGRPHPFVNIVNAAYQWQSVAPPFYTYRTWMVSPKTALGVASEPATAREREMPGCCFFGLANNGSLDVHWLNTSAMRAYGSHGVFAAQPFGTADGPGGYFGTQSDADPNSGGFLFSVWDKARRKPQSCAHAPNASSMCGT